MTDIKGTDTPASPARGIDPKHFRESVIQEAARAADLWMKDEISNESYAKSEAKRDRLLALIDASPKGGSEPVATLTISEVGGEMGATHTLSLTHIHDSEAFGKLGPGTYQLAVCSMQATSAEVGE